MKLTSVNGILRWWLTHRDTLFQLPFLKNCVWHIKSSTVTILSVQFSGGKYIHTVVRPISRTFSSFKIETLYPLTTSHFLFPQPMATTIVLSMNLITLGAPFKQNHTVFVFLWLGYFTLHNVLKVHLHCSMWPSFLPFLRLSNTASYEYMRFTIHLSVDISVASASGLLQTMLLWTWVCK